MKIIVNDTNILIDLANLDLLDLMTELNFEFHTTDFIISEIQNPEQLQKVQNIIDNNKLTIIKTKAEEYSKISELQTKNLSFEDCSIWYYAKKVNGILLTGDGNLRKTVKSSGIEVKGILFIFDQLIDNNIIDFQTAIQKISKLSLLNTRLPKKDIENRIEKWYLNL